MRMWGFVSEKTWPNMENTVFSMLGHVYIRIIYKYLLNNPIPF